MKTGTKVFPERVCTHLLIAREGNVGFDYPLFRPVIHCSLLAFTLISHGSVKKNAMNSSLWCMLMRLGYESPHSKLQSKPYCFVSADMHADRTSNFEFCFYQDCVCLACSCQIGRTGRAAPSGC